MKRHSDRKIVLSMRKGGASKHVAFKVLEQLEDAVVTIMGYDLYSLNYFEHLILRAQLKLTNWFNINARHYNFIFSTKKTSCFIALMGLQMCKLLRPILRDKSVAKVVYVFDVWEPEYDWFHEEMKLWTNIDIVYFAFKQANEYFWNKFDFETAWMPQAVDVTEFYEFRNLEKEKLIVQVGRKDKELHSFFLRFSKKHNMDYIYEKEKGRVIAPQRRDYIQLISKAFIFVVSPQHVDFEAKTGSVSPVTARYYEGYASAALVVGKKTTSDEFDLLFEGYPFVEYRKDEAKFEQEILSMLKAEFDVFKLIEEYHTWMNRVKVFMVKKRLHGLS